MSKYLAAGDKGSTVETEKPTGKYLIWDFDRTLGYREGRWRGALLAALHREMPDHPATAEQLNPGLGPGYRWDTPDRSYGELVSATQWWDELDEFFALRYINAGIAADQATRLAKLVRETYLDLANWRLFDETIPTLELLAAQGWQHIVLSNHVPELSLLIRHLGLEPLLFKVFNSAETGYEKPHPQAFRLVLDAIGPAAAVWMIGDNPQADIAGATAAGIPAILVRAEHPTAGYCCADLTGVPAILAQHGATE